MKKTYAHYLAHTEEDINTIWDNALVVIDTNVLLDFYCYGQATLDDYYAVLEEARNRKNLWLPYQIGLEFFENRHGIISKQLNQYDNLLKYIDGAKERITDLKNTSPSHSHLDFDDIAKRYQEAIAPLKRRIESQKKKHPDYLGEDKVLERLKDIYDDKAIGEPFTPEQTEKLIEEGEERYKNKIPPGFRDEDKKESEDKPSRNRKYGDLIIWKQMLEKAAETNKPIIFITNDAKDDWIIKAKDGRKLGPLPALRHEMLRTAQTDFLLYSADEFLEEAHTRYNLPIRNQSVDEVKKYRQLEMDRIATGNNSAKLFHYYNSLSGVHYPRDDYHYLMHRARTMLRHAPTICEEEEYTPSRLMDTITEIKGIYNTIRFKGQREPELTLTLLNHNNMLIRRCINITAGQGEKLQVFFADLLSLNRQIIDYLGDSPEQLKMIYADR